MLSQRERGSVPVVLLLLLVLSAGIFTVWKIKIPSSALLSPTPSASSSPQTQGLIYQNSELGFKLTLPSKDFAAMPDSETEFFSRSKADFRKNFTYYVEYAPPKVIGAVIVKKIDQDINSQFDKAPFTVWAFDNPKKFSVDQWYQNYWYYPFVWGMFSWTDRAHVAPVNEATVSGQPVSFGVVKYQPGSPKFYLVPSKDKMFLIKILEDDHKSGSQILSTLEISN